MKRRSMPCRFSERPVVLPPAACVAHRRRCQQAPAARRSRTPSCAWLQRRATDWGASGTCRGAASTAVARHEQDTLPSTTARPLPLPGSRYSAECSRRYLRTSFPLASVTHARTRVVMRSYVSTMNGGPENTGPEKIWKSTE